MKKALLTLSLLFTLTAITYAQTNIQCDFFIRSDFDSECVLTTYKEKGPLLLHDESECMIACAGSQVTYYAVNLPIGFTTEWIVIGTDDYTVNQQGTQISVNWPDEISSGHIILKATGPDNTICIKETCIELIEKPMAGIISNPPHIGYIYGDIQYIEVCDGQEIQFFSNSTSSAEAPIVGYMWISNFETWSTQNFTLTADINIYGDEFKIIHTVINECGCIDTIYYIIKIHKYPILEVSCYGTACENDQATYSVDPSICNTFYWLVEGGEIIAGQTTNEITVLWNNIENGYGYLAIDGTNCGQEICPTLSYIAIPVITENANIIGPDTVCVDDIVYYELPQWASTEYNFTVTPNNGVSILPSGTPHKFMLRFDLADTYTITADYNCEFLGCSGIANEKTVYAKKQFNIIANTMACAGDTVYFDTNTGGGSVFNWAIKDGSMNIIYTTEDSEFNYEFNTAGSYTISAENPFFCKPAEKSIIIHELPPTPQPDDSNWITEVCKNSGYLFTAEPINEQYYLHWETSCAEPNEFDGPEYNVHYNNLICDIHLMHVDKITGCVSEAFVHEIEEFQPDEIQWDEYQVCANEILNISIPSENNVLYEWRIMQDNLASVITGQYSNDINIQANALDGLFSLILRRSFCENYVEDTVQIEIIPYLIPNFNKINNICQYDTVELAPNYEGDLIGTWVWTIEGNSFPIFGTAEDAIIYYAFNNAGIIPISLSFTAENCTQAYETVGTVLVNPAPDVSCSYTNISPTSIELNASVQDQDLGFYTHAWSVPAMGPVVIVNNPIETSYIVTVTNTLTGCKTIKEIVLPSQGGGCNINQGSITYTQNCDSAVFNRLGHSETEMISWSFRHNSSSPSYTTSGNYDEICSVRFENAGYYQILASENYDDCNYYAELNIEVPLIPRIYIKRTCQGTDQINLQLINLSDYMYGVNIDTITWSVNGIPSTNIATVNSGTHVIEFTVYYTYNSIQYQCATSKTVTYQRGEANFNISSGPYCAGTPVQFTDNSTNAISWLYEFDENSDYQNRNPNNIQNFGNSDAGSISVTLSIQDNIGCYSEYSTNITVNPNTLAGVLDPVDGPFCVGEEWPADYNFINNDNQEPYNIIWFPLDQTANDTTTTNTNSLLQTGSYYVLLSNTNNCMFQSDYKNICFENTPHAEISGNDTYCPDETIRLFGQTGNYTYLWEGLGNLSFNTPNINLSASDLTPGNYSLILTVSNNDCSSSDTMNILINSKPIAPLIDFGVNQCLYIPPVDLISLSNQALYWSTGAYGAHATTFNPGYHLAHYIDAITGCKSEYAKINVIKPPDFNELMSGCFKFCYDDLPRWILPPMGYFEIWDWYLNSYSIQHGTYESPYNENILLNIPSYGSYRMRLRYPTNCITNSRYLEIDKKEYCDSCEISMRILEPICDVEGCELILEFNYHIQNTSLTSTATLLEVNNPNINWLQPILPINIPVASGINFNFYVVLENLDQQIIQLEFVFYQNNILCTHIVEINLSQVLANCITEECRGMITSIDFMDNISSIGMSYFDFRIDFEINMNNIQVYSDQVNIIDYEYYPSSGEIRGLFSITPLQLQELIDNEEDICFTIYACTNDIICEAEICFPASQLGVQQKSSSFKIIEQKEKLEETISLSQFGLYPNPTNNTLYITGNETEFLQAIIIDMQGRKLKISDSSEINVSKLNTGTYIVRVINKAEEIQYLKFIKK